MRAALYARVSTDDQARNNSLPSQIEACQGYARARGMEVIAEICDDASGTTLNRPGLDRLRTMLANHEVGAVITLSSDRLARNIAGSLILREECKRHNVELHFTNQGVQDETPEGQMAANIFATFDEYWRVKIIESCTRGRRHKAASGRWPGDGNIKYGYMKVGRGPEAALAIDQQEAQIVRRIFDSFLGRYGEPMGAQAIARALTAEHIPTPSRGRRGKLWYTSTIYLILDSDAYIGKFVFGGNPVELPDLSIIDNETWRAVRKVRQRNRAIAGSYAKKNQYLLSGRMACTCGWVMAGSPSRNGNGRIYNYYECTRRRAGAGDCKSRIRADIADEIVWNWLAGLMSDEAELDKQLRLFVAKRERELSPKRERLDIVMDLIADQERKIKRYSDDYRDASDDIEAAIFKGHLKMATQAFRVMVAERDTLQAELAQAELSEADIKEIKELSGQVRDKLDHASFAKRRALVNVYDLKAQISYNEAGERGIAAQCWLNLDEATWLALDVVRKIDSNATITLQLPNKFVIFSTWLPIPKRASLADELFAFLQQSESIVNS